MFIRPDWKDPEPYKLFLRPGYSHYLAWEFLRRNPDYQKDVDAYENEVVEFRKNNPHSYDEGETQFRSPACFSEMVCCHIFHNRARWEYWCRYIENRWKLNHPMMTTEQSCGEDFIMDAYDNPDLFKVAAPGGKIDGPRVLIPVDLSEPLETLQERVMWQVRRLRNDGIKQGTITPRTARILAPRCLHRATAHS